MNSEGAGLADDMRAGGDQALLRDYEAASSAPLSSGPPTMADDHRRTTCQAGQFLHGLGGLFHPLAGCLLVRLGKVLAERSGKGAGQREQGDRESPHASR